MTTELEIRQRSGLDERRPDPDAEGKELSDPKDFWCAHFSDDPPGGEGNIAPALSRYDSTMLSALGLSLESGMAPRLTITTPGKTPAEHVVSVRPSRGVNPGKLARAVLRAYDKSGQAKGKPFNLTKGDADALRGFEVFVASLATRGAREAARKDKFTADYIWDKIDDGKIAEVSKQLADFAEINAEESRREHNDTLGKPSKGEKRQTPEQAGAKARARQERHGKVCRGKFIEPAGGNLFQLSEPVRSSLYVFSDSVRYANLAPGFPDKLAPGAAVHVVRFLARLGKPGVRKYGQLFDPFDGIENPSEEDRRAVSLAAAKLKEHKLASFYRPRHRTIRLGGRPW